MTNTATDWDSYYQSVPSTARLTRRYTTSMLLSSIRRYAGQKGPLAIVEIGGANSCFVDAILAGIPCRSYDVVDTNRYGLSLLEKRTDPSVVRLHEQSVLALSMDLTADVVYSVGLVEHFDPAETRRAVLAHFEPLRAGGIVIVTFPTPTWLYRASRRSIETAGMWKFPDERPLQPAEVRCALEEKGEVLFEKTMWPLVLTQHLMVARKR